LIKILVFPAPNIESLLTGKVSERITQDKEFKVAARKEVCHNKGRLTSFNKAILNQAIAPENVSITEEPSIGF
jgi:hypothetical protein